MISPMKLVAQDRHEHDRDLRLVRQEEPDHPPERLRPALLRAPARPARPPPKPRQPPPPTTAAPRRRSARRPRRPPQAARSLRLVHSSRRRYHEMPRVAFCNRLRGTVAGRHRARITAPICDAVLGINRGQGDAERHEERRRGVIGAAGPDCRAMTACASSSVREGRRLQPRQVVRGSGRSASQLRAARHGRRLVAASARVGRAGVDQTTISRLENGRLRSLRLTRIGDLDGRAARRLDVRRPPPMPSSRLPPASSRSPRIQPRADARPRREPRRASGARGSRADPRAGDGCRRTAWSAASGAAASASAGRRAARPTYQAVAVAASAMPWDSSQRSASIAALQPSPAAVTAWR